MSYSVVGPVGKRWPLDGFYPAPILYMSLCIITSPTAKFSSSAALCSCVSADFCWAHLAWLKSLRFSYIFQLQCCLLPLGKKKKKKHRAVWLKSEIKLLTDLIYIFNMLISWSGPWWVTQRWVISKYFLEVTGVFWKKKVIIQTLCPILWEKSPGVHLHVARLLDKHPVTVLWVPYQKCYVGATPVCCRRGILSKSLPEILISSCNPVNYLFLWVNLRQFESFETEPMPLPGWGLPNQSVQI